MFVLHHPIQLIEHDSDGLLVVVSISLMVKTFKWLFLMRRMFPFRVNHGERVVGVSRNPQVSQLFSFTAPHGSCKFDTL